VLDIDPTLLDVDPETLASWYAELASSRSGHRPHLDADELRDLRHGSSEWPARIRRILTPRWDPSVSPQVLSHWLSLADRLPAAADEARGLAFLRSLHDLGARPGWPGDDRLPRTGGSGPLQLPVWRGADPSHPAPVPLAAWQAAASRAVQKGLLSQPTSPFNRSPSLRDLQISAPGSGPEILRFADLLASAAGLPEDASLAPPLAEIDAPAPSRPSGARVASDAPPRLPFPPWTIKSAPPLVTIQTIAKASELLRHLESDPSTAVPPTRSAVRQPDRAFVEAPPEIQGDETGAPERTSFRPPTPIQRVAYREWARDYLAAHRDADPSLQARLPHPSTIPDPETLMSADEAAAGAMRLRHLTLLAKGIPPQLSTSGPAVRSRLQSDAARERLRISHSPKRPNPLQEIEDLAQGLRTPRADEPPESHPGPGHVEGISWPRSVEDPPMRTPKEALNPTPPNPRGTRGAKPRIRGPGGAHENRLPAWAPPKGLVLMPSEAGDHEGNARAPRPKGGEAHIVRERQKPAVHASSRSTATKMDRKALGRLVAMFMLRIAEGMRTVP